MRSFFLFFFFLMNGWCEVTHIEQLTFSSMGFEKAGEAYFSPDGKKILFQAVPQGESHYQIYGMELEKRVPFLVSTGKGACTCAYFRPDGKKILFASSHTNPEATESKKREGERYVWELTPYMNLYEANPDGTEMTPLTSGPAYHAECAYSPDGSHIVFASNESGSMNLYTMRADGSEVRQITHTEHSYNGGPFFSPDGRHIAFRSDRHAPHHFQLFLCDFDGGNERPLTDDEEMCWAPYWHPNGKVIAYTRSVEGRCGYAIYLLNIETGVQSCLISGSPFDGLPAFSGDGRKILWTSKRGDGTCQIFMADFVMPEELQ